ncbi:hypothetical protein BKA70DRAFT_1222607 [Coprinopsis sp. MPI-PUGE-AT-0042]|nr:hypothetical protein BKA70DRAFT_1239368 [Coprinopsis sp. MPI-PUGE-AT-0042]KAH6908379.1 hypothetical protein BKA70DRAFT_1222607 [Coprinopsis sp. MPI-PUGE-AT-0042]
MSSEGASTTKKSKRELVKKWAKNWGGLRSGSPAPAATQSAPPLPQAAEATSNTPSSQHTLEKSPSSSGAEQANVGASEILTGTNEALEATPSRRDVAKDYLSVTGSFLQMVLKRLPEALDPNPVKAAFSLAKMILDMKQVCPTLSLSLNGFG